MTFAPSHEAKATPTLTRRDMSRMFEGTESYLLYADGEPVGMTDEYGTCLWAAEGWTEHGVEDLILAEDGSWRDVEIGTAR
jgi:hypothetical protein